MSPGRVRALLFDFDDTIVESERFTDAVLRGYLRAGFGVVLSEQDVDAFFGQSWREVFSRLRARFCLRGSYDEFMRGFVREKRRSLAEAKLRVASGLDLILSLPVAKAIVSGSMREELAMTMENAGISAEAFFPIVSSEDCRKGKPDPEGYARALSLLGVPAAEALAFEDSPPGIEAAKKCGARVVFIREFARGNWGSLAEMSFDTLETAYPWVKEGIEGKGPA